MSRTREVEQQMAIQPQDSNTDIQPTNNHKFDSDYDANEALRQVLADRALHQAKYPPEDLVRRMDATSVRPRAVQ